MHIRNVNSIKTNTHAVLVCNSAKVRHKSHVSILLERRSEVYFGLNKYSKLHRSAALMQAP